MESEPVSKRMKFASNDDQTNSCSIEPVAEPIAEPVAENKKSIYTARATSWALKTFQEWKTVRNKAFPDDPVPEDFLDKCHSDAAHLIHWISRFVTEARRNHEGKPYTPNSLTMILWGIQRYMVNKNSNSLRFMDSKDPQFSDLHRTICCTFASLHEKGIGVTKHTETLTPEEENRLWELGLLGTDTPLTLQRAVFFSTGKAFCIRGGERNLKPSQFRRESNPDRYVYFENGCLKKSGGKRRLSASNKVIPVYANPFAGKRCLVYLLDLYMSKLPFDAFEKGVFYLRPKMEAPSQHDSVWYEPIPVGKDKLRTLVRDTCNAAGIRNKNSSCLRATENVPERLIRSSTDLWMQALRRSQRPSDEQPSDEHLSDEWPSDEHPLDERPSDEHPLDEWPSDEEPLDERLSNEWPSDDHSLDLDEQPLDDQTSDEQPWDKEVLDVQPMDEQRLNEQPSHEQSSNVKPTDEQPSPELSLQPMDERPSVEQPSHEQSSNVQPTDKQPSHEQPSDVQPMDEHPSVKCPSYVQPTDEQLSHEQSSDQQEISNISINIGDQRNFGGKVEAIIIHACTCSSTSLSSGSSKSSSKTSSKSSSNSTYRREQILPGFSLFNNCTVNIQNFVVNINHSPAIAVEKEVDETVVKNTLH